jgi:HSP20 family protein
MLMRTDPVRDFDRLAEAVFGTQSRPVSMPMDAYRHGDVFVVALDLPGVDADSIDLTVERNVLTVHAERHPSMADNAERVVGERTYGVFSRQLFLGDTLDADQLTAQYDNGVLTIRIPVAEQAKPRRIEIDRSHKQHQLTSSPEVRVPCRNVAE